MKAGKVTRSAKKIIRDDECVKKTWGAA